MSDATPQIVITGIGIVSPLGVGYDAFASSLASGKSPIKVSPTELSGVPIKFCSEVDGFDPKQLVRRRKNIKLMSREIQFGVAAAELAILHAEMDVSVVDSDRFGAVLGSEMLYGDPRELMPIYEKIIENGQFSMADFGKSIGELFPLWMLKYLPNMPACHVGIAHQACGHKNSVVQGDASSLLAVAEAASVIQRGWADVMISGGVGSGIHPPRVVHLSKHMFASREDDPARACRPFDADRDGTVPGEGAGVFVLETEEHAKARGAKLLARIAGFGRAHELNHPYHRGLENGASMIAIQRSIRAALADANLSVGDIDHVNAHGLGSQLADEFEAKAIRAELGDTPVVGLKGYFGNLGAGGGTIEMAGSIMAFQCGTVPKSRNYETPDANCPVNVLTAAKSTEKSSAMVLSQSSSGQAAAIVLQQA